MKFNESMELTNSQFYHVTDKPQCQLRIENQVLKCITRISMANPKASLFPSQSKH